MVERNIDVVEVRGSNPLSRIFFINWSQCLLRSIAHHFKNFDAMSPSEDRAPLNLNWLQYFLEASLFFMLFYWSDILILYYYLLSLFSMISSATFIKSGTKLEHCPSPDKPEFAFIWRSNVGKSSLINALCKRKNLAQTSPKPWKTQLMNFFDIELTTKHWKKIPFTLTDLPWYGYAKVSKEKRFQFEDMIAEYLTQRENLQMTFVLIDSAIPPQKIDIEFVTWLTEEEVP